MTHHTSSACGPWVLTFWSSFGHCMVSCGHLWSMAMSPTYWPPLQPLQQSSDYSCSLVLSFCCWRTFLPPIILTYNLSLLHHHPLISKCCWKCQKLLFYKWAASPCLPSILQPLLSRHCLAYNVSPILYKQMMATAFTCLQSTKPWLQGLSYRYYQVYYQHTTNSSFYSIRHLLPGSMLSLAELSRLCKAYFSGHWQASRPPTCNIWMLVVAFHCLSYEKAELGNCSKSPAFSLLTRLTNESFANLLVTVPNNQHIG